jgi:hypothetical protein
MQIPIPNSLTFKRAGYLKCLPVNIIMSYKA